MPKATWCAAREGAGPRRDRAGQEEAGQQGGGAHEDLRADRGQRPDRGHEGRRRSPRPRSSSPRTPCPSRAGRARCRPPIRRGRGRARRQARARARRSRRCRPRRRRAASAGPPCRAASPGRRARAARRGPRVPRSAGSARRAGRPRRRRPRRAAPGPPRGQHRGDVTPSPSASQSAWARAPSRRVLARPVQPGDAGGRPVGQEDAEADDGVQRRRGERERGELRRPQVADDRGVDEQVERLGRQRPERGDGQGQDLAVAARGTHAAPLYDPPWCRRPSPPRAEDEAAPVPRARRRPRRVPRGGHRAGPRAPALRAVHAPRARARRGAPRPPLPRRPARPAAARRLRGPPAPPVHARLARRRPGRLLHRGRRPAPARRRPRPRRRGPPARRRDRAAGAGADGAAAQPPAPSRRAQPRDARPGAARPRGALPGLDRLVPKAARVAFRPAVGEHLSARSDPAARDLVRHAVADVGGNPNLARSWARFARRWPRGPRRELLDAYPACASRCCCCGPTPTACTRCRAPRRRSTSSPTASCASCRGTGFLIAYDDAVGVARELVAFCG